MSMPSSKRVLTRLGEALRGILACHDNSTKNAIIVATELPAFYARSRIARLRA